MNLLFKDSPLRQLRLNEFSKLVYEYLLVLSPERSVSEKLLLIKNVFTARYGCECAVNLMPHITLVNFVQLERNEKKIIHYFDRFSKNIAPFEVKLSGFGEFSRQTIYVNVLSKQPIVKIVKNIQTKFGGLLRPFKSSQARFIVNPHVTIARKMQDIQYEGVWKEWKDARFNAVFQVNEMVLLKRKTTGSKCEVIAKFKFSGNGFSEEQLRLEF